MKIKTSMHPVDKAVKALISNTTRVTLTASKPFDPKHKKKVPVITDIRDKGDIDKLFSLLTIIPENEAMNWFCVTDYYLSFMQEKQLLGVLGIINWEILRLPDNSDYDLKQGHHLFNYFNKLNTCIHK